jgi:hypothetical protein
MNYDPSIDVETLLVSPFKPVSKLTMHRAVDVSASNNLVSTILWLKNNSISESIEETYPVSAFGA